MLLLAHTANHHLSNWFKLRRGDGQRFTVPLDLGGSNPTNLTLRTRAGDLSILYEVFAEKAYFVDDAKLPPESVTTVIDCGAHIGLTALYFASRYPNARIIAVEPNPGNYELLRANTAGEARIITLQGCVSDQSGAARISIDGPGWGYRIDPAGVPVPAFTIQDLRDRYAIDMIDFLKIDIEGAEKGVFAQGVGDVRVIVAELHGDYTIESFARDVAPMSVTSKPGQDTVLAYVA